MNCTVMNAISDPKAAPYPSPKPVNCFSDPFDNYFVLAYSFTSMNYTVMNAISDPKAAPSLDVFDNYLVLEYSFTSMNYNVMNATYHSIDSTSGFIYFNPVNYESSFLYWCKKSFTKTFHKDKIQEINFATYSIFWKYFPEERVIIMLFNSVMKAYVYNNFHYDSHIRIAFLTVNEILEVCEISIHRQKMLYFGSLFIQRHKEIICGDYDDEYCGEKCVSKEGMYRNHI
jgi:hypothetical protein